MPLKSILLLIIVCVICGGCNQSNIEANGPGAKQSDFNALAKSDIGVVMEIHVNEARGQLRT